MKNYCASNNITKEDVYYIGERTKTLSVWRKLRPLFKRRNNNNKECTSHKTHPQLFYKQKPHRVAVYGRLFVVGLIVRTMPL